MPVEKKSVYVKIDNNEAVASKRLFLESIESLLNMLLTSEKFISLCDKESKEISHLKSRYSESIITINKSFDILPKEEEEIVQEKEIKIKGKPAAKKEMSKEQIREKELKQIKERLARLK